MSYQIPGYALFLSTTETAQKGGGSVVVELHKFENKPLISSSSSFGRHGNDQAFVAIKFLGIFSPKKKLYTNRLPDATGGCFTLSAPSDINRSIRNTHTHTHTHPPPSQTHELDACSSYLNQSRSKIGLLLTHLLSFIIKRVCVYVSYVEEMCMCLSAVVFVSISPNNKGRTQTQTSKVLCHFSRSLSLNQLLVYLLQENGRKEKLKCSAESPLCAMSPAAGKYPWEKLTICFY